MRDDDQQLVSELKKIGDKPCLAMAHFFEEAERDPERVVARARQAEGLPESMTTLDALLENARAIARELVAEAAQKAERRLAAQRTDASIDAIIEDAERLLYEGDFAAAKAGFANAVTKTEEAFGASSQALVVPLMGLARASGGETGRSGPALDDELGIQRRALGIAEATLADDDMLLAECLHAHGVSTWASGDASKAVELLKRSVDVVTRAGAEDKGAFLAPLVGALLDAKRPEDALPYARELLAAAEGGGETDLTTLFVVGQAFRDAGAHEEARAVLERFLAGYAGDGQSGEIRDLVRGWLAALPRPS